jgi:hypothetical protein
MYPWRIQRRILAVLLMLPLIHFVLNFAGEFRDIVNPEPTVWEDEVRSIERRYSLNQPDTRPLVIAGGRAAKLWRDQSRTLFPMPVINAGFGAANLDDLLYYFDRLVGNFNPGAVLLIPSASDFSIRDSKTPADFNLLLRGFASYVGRLEGHPHLYVTTLPKWPRYPELWLTVDTVNRELATLASERDDITLIDTRSSFEQASGQPVQEIFRIDGVNLNELGYTQLSLMLRQQMERDYPHFY